MTAADFAAARKALGLSQASLAAMLGYNARQRISAIETGREMPGPAVMRLMRAYLDGYRPHDWPAKPTKTANTSAQSAK